MKCHLTVQPSSRPSWPTELKQKKKKSWTSYVILTILILANRAAVWIQTPWEWKTHCISTFWEENLHLFSKSNKHRFKI